MQDKIQFIPEEDLKVTPVPFAALSQTQNWGMALANIQEVWAVSKQGEGIKIAILDTGFAEHADLVEAWKAEEAVNCTPEASVNDQGSGHGVHVAGIIAGSDNDFGVVGVAPKAKCYAIRVLDNSGSGSYDTIAAGLRKAIDLEVDIINMSLGAPTEPPAFIHDLIKEAVSKGIVVLAAAGNDSHAVNYPARYDEVIAVAALDESGNLATFTSRDFTVDIVAPGTNIYSTHLNNNYCKMSGTSQSAPFVAGICALIKAALKNQNLLPEFGNQFCQEDMMVALRNISSLQNYQVQPGEEQNWGPGVPKLANIDWSNITVKKS
jgi:subtilisin family serine protease